MTSGRTVNSQNTDWCTPPKYIEAVRAFFGGDIDLDPCSNKWSTVNARTEFSLPEYDGLREEWNFSTIYVNPPYGADRERGLTIKDWLRKCAGASRQFGAEVLALVPVATNTSHRKEYVWGQASGICFLYDTRLRFWVEGHEEPKGAPMACAMVYWGDGFGRFEQVFLEFGAVVDLRPLHGKAMGNDALTKQASLFDGA